MIIPSLLASSFHFSISEDPLRPDPWSSTINGAEADDFTESGTIR
jgi:hypothetical protein